MSLEPIIAVLSRILGLAPRSLGERALRRCIDQRMRATGDADLHAYGERLHRSPSEVRALIEAVVVPESWFFRESAAFDLLRELTRERLRPARLGRPPRLLSLGCSTGEEPYSLAMCLLDAGLGPGSFEVTGIDISRPALAHARAGLYRGRSFRGPDQRYRERWFSPSGAGYRLREPACSCVRFWRGNILQPNSRWRSGNFDVIFLRNVLIYFTESARRRIIARLPRMLAAGGLLFAGHAEANLYLDAGFERLDHARAFAFSLADKMPRPPGVSPKPMPNAAALRKAVAPRALPARPSAAVTRPHPPSPRPSATLATIQRLADQGQLVAAERHCRRYLEHHGASPNALFLLGLIQGAGGDRDAAALTYRKVLYLEPEHGPALMQMALIAEHQGDLERARRLRKRAAAAAETDDAG